MSLKEQLEETGKSGRQGEPGDDLGFPKLGSESGSDIVGRVCSLKALL